MKKIFLAILTILLMYGCVSEKKRTKICANCPVKEITIDSTIYKEYFTFRDSVLMVPKDSAQIEYVVGPCPDGSIPNIKEIYKRDGRKTTITGRVKNGKITVKADIGVEQLKFEIKEKIREIQRLKHQSKALPCKNKYGEEFFYYTGIVFYVLACLIISTLLIWLGIKKNKKK